MTIKTSVQKSFHARRHVHKRLVRRITVFPIIAVVMFGIVAVDTARSGISPLWLLGGLVFGLIVGSFAGKIFKIRWNDDEAQVVMGIDRLSVLLIIAYVLFRFLTDKLLDSVVHGEALVIFTYSSLAGILIGRMISVASRVMNILKSRELW